MHKREFGFRSVKDPLRQLGRDGLHINEAQAVMGMRNADLGARHGDGDHWSCEWECVLLYQFMWNEGLSLFPFIFLLILSAYSIPPLLFLSSPPGAQVKSACLITILAVSSPSHLRPLQKQEPPCFSFMKHSDFHPIGHCGPHMSSSWSVGWVKMSGWDVLMWKGRCLASLERKRGGRERSLLGVAWCLEPHQPQLESTGQLAGLLLPGWLRSDFAGSYHLLALHRDKGGCTEVHGGGSEGRQSMGSLFFLFKGDNIWPPRKAMGKPKVEKSRLCGRVGLCSGIHTQVGVGPKAGEP